ncbi:MAG: DUF2752 domain-containing protein [Muribaculaceae bacterium]|nr:DUF2752 domain-containing protein [Muribaculaceae bacterium]
MRADNKRHSGLITVTVIVAVILLLCLYGMVDPQDTQWGKYFPKCPVKLMTGLQCPSCGLQRSLHALLHGDFLGALRCNWFIIFSLLYLGGVLATRRCSPRWQSLHNFFWGRTGAAIYITLYLLWFVIRNVLGI